ncbi:unnamed protein product [Closterium sp. NIES-53]
MASLRVLAFDHEGRPVQFDTWLDDLQLYLLSDIKDGVSQFDHVSGTITAPPATANSATPSQTAQALYDVAVARYSSPGTAALCRLLLPYLFPELSAFATLEDLVSHLRASDAHYCDAVPAEFLDKNQPQLFITLYFIITRLPASLRSVRDHFLSLDPISLTVDLLEQHLLVAETSAVAVGAARGTPRLPFFEGTSGLLLLVPSAAAARARVARVVEVAAAVAEVAAGVVVGAAVEVVVAVGLVEGLGALVAAVEAAEGVAAVAAVGLVVVGLELGVLVLEVASVTSSSVGARTRRPSTFTCGRLHTQHRCFSRLNNSWRAEYGDDVELPRWADLLRSTIAIFDLDFEAILSAMYALSNSAEGVCYWCVPPDPGIATAALGASESGTPPGTAPAQALHTFTLDSGASACFFRDSTTLTPLSRPVPVRLADPSGGPVVARSSTVLLCPAVLSSSLSGLHLLSFYANLVSTAGLQDAMVTTTTPRGQVAASCPCRLLSHQTLLWHHHLGHPSLPRLCCMHSCLLVSGLPRSLPPLPPSPAPPCLPCVEGRQRAAPHSSVPSTTAPLQTLHMDVWGPARVGDASVFRVWGSCAFVRDTSADKLSPRAIPCVFLGFVLDEPVWQFYHPTSRRVFPSQDNMFDESVPFYRLFPYRSAPPVPPPLFLALGPPPVDTLPPKGPAPLGVSRVDPLPGPAPVQAARLGLLRLGVFRLGVVSLGVVSMRVLSLGVLRRRVRSPEVLSLRVLLRLEVSLVLRQSPQQLREWFLWRARLRSGATRAGGDGAAGAGGAEATARASFTGVTGLGGARTRGTGAAGTGGVEGVGVGAAGAVDPGGAVRPQPYFAPLLQQVLGTPSSTSLTPPLLCPSPDQSQPPLQPASPLPAPSPYTEQSGGLTECREPASRPVLPVRTTCRVPCSPPPPVLSTHAMTLRPSSVPLRVPLPSPPESSLLAVPGPESDRARASSPTVSCLIATAVTDPSFESAAACALVAELLDFAAACRLDYATALVAESASTSPPSVGVECALGTDILEDRQEDFESLAAAQAVMDAEMASRKSSGTYIDEVPPRGANIVDGMWIFRVKRPPDSTPAFKARYAARGFSQRQGVDYFRNFSPTPKMTTLRVLLHVAGQRDYELHSLDFSTAFLQGNIHEEIWLRRPPGFTESFHAGTQWGLRWPVYGLRQAPCELHDTLRTTLAALGFAPATADLSLFLCTNTSLPPFYVLVYVDDLVFATAHIEALTLVKSFSASASSSPRHSPILCLPATRSQLHLRTSPHRKVQWDAAKRVLRYLCSTSSMGLVLGGRGLVVLTGHADASWVDDSATHSSYEAEIYAGAMAAQELRWLTYVLTDLREQPRSPPVLYVDNKAMIALCQDHRLEHRTKHIALRYFLARELQQRGQLRLA